MSPLPAGLRTSDLSLSPSRSGAARSLRFPLLLGLNRVTQERRWPRILELPCGQPNPRLCPSTSSTTTAWGPPVPWSKSHQLDTVGMPSRHGRPGFPGLPESTGASVANGARGGGEGARAVGVEEGMPHPAFFRRGGGVVTAEGVRLA